MEEEPERKKRRPLDHSELMKAIDDNQNEPPMELVVVKEVVEVEEEDEGKDKEVVAEVDFVGLREEFKTVSDWQLGEKINRMKGNFRLMKSTLPDNGAKFLLQISRMEAEVERRKTDIKDLPVVDKPPQSKRLHFSGGVNGLKQETPLSTEDKPSEFFAQLSAKLEPELIKRTTRSCNQPEKKLNGHVSSREMPFQCATSLANNNRKQMISRRDRRGTSSDFSQMMNRLPRRPINKAGTPIYDPLKWKKEKTVVCLDDEEINLDANDSSPDQEDPIFDDLLCQLESLAVRFQDSSIYYPSRDVPDNVSVSFTDLKCLEPQGCLSSVIMNFYIRYLQRLGTSTGRSRGDYHFFNTFFYDKLKVAVSDKGNDDAAFTKLRRWWRGTNIFHKAFIFIPINEDLHWSLIIICIPDKEEESGPIVLHLDSLQFHPSRPIFENIKRFIEREWDHLSRAEASSDLPWEHLPRKIIEERSIKVPQQKNESDCGLFVLFFIQRFIEDAPERMRKKDLQMFGKQWFKPAEASALRDQIIHLLIAEFEAAQPQQECTSKHGKQGPQTCSVDVSATEC